MQCWWAANASFVLCYLKTVELLKGHIMAILAYLLVDKLGHNEEHKATDESSTQRSASSYIFPSIDPMGIL